MIRKIIGSSPVLISAIPVKQVSEDNSSNEDKEEKNPYKCRPSDLPLYTPLHASEKKSDDPHKTDERAREPGFIESGFRALRMEILSAYKTFESQKQLISDYIETGVAHTQSTIEYLNEPENTIPRVGAIAFGGLAGLIFSLRGGFVRRVVYTGAGAGAVAAVCYPEQAEKYGNVALKEGKKGVTIAYNFIFGIKPGDDVEPMNFPELPKMSEITDSLMDLAKSARDALFSPKK